RLRAVERQVTDGHGLVLLVTGEPGQGKSRLVYEFLRDLEAGDVVEAACVSYGAALPYYPILEALRRYFELVEGTPDEQSRRRLADGLAALGLNEPNAVDLLAHFIGVSVAPGFLARLQAVQVKEQTLELLRAVFVRASGRRPIVLVVENVHWID